MLIPRRTAPQQLDLFDPPCAAGSLPTPQWQSLPDEARLTLTTSMTRLILDLANDADRQRKEAGHDA